MRRQTNRYIHTPRECALYLIHNAGLVLISISCILFSFLVNLDGTALHSTWYKSSQPLHLTINWILSSSGLQWQYTFQWYHEQNLCLCETSLLLGFWETMPWSPPENISSGGHSTTAWSRSHRSGNHPSHRWTADGMAQRLLISTHLLLFVNPPDPKYFFRDKKKPVSAWERTGCYPNTCRAGNQTGTL